MDPRLACLMHARKVANAHHFSTRCSVSAEQSRCDAIPCAHSRPPSPTDRRCSAAALDDHAAAAAADDEATSRGPRANGVSAARQHGLSVSKATKRAIRRSSMLRRSSIDRAPRPQSGCCTLLNGRRRRVHRGEQRSAENERIAAPTSTASLSAPCSSVVRRGCSASESPLATRSRR